MKRAGDVHPNPGPTQKKTEARKLYIWQHNVNGMTAERISEMGAHLRKREIQIAILQETQLTAKRQIKVPGYTILRQDRQTARGAGPTKGGGLITLVAEGMQHAVVKGNWTAPNDTATEVLVVDVWEGKRKTPIVNVYVPPICSVAADERPQYFDPNHLPAGRRTVIGGDFNARLSTVRDTRQPSDKRGKVVETFIQNAGIVLLNTGAATRIPWNRRENHAIARTAPDLTLISQDLYLAADWAVLDDSLGSDHLPIVCSLTEAPAQERRQPRRGWKTTKADWTLFAARLDTAIERERGRDVGRWNARSSKQRVADFTRLVRGAAKAAIPYGVSATRRKVWCDDIVHKHVRGRNAALRRLRRAAERNDASTNDRLDEWCQATAAAKKAIKTAKRRHWQAFATTLSPRTNSARLWSTLRAIDGRAKAPPSGAALEADGRQQTTPTAKANAFARQYARVSSLTLNKEEHVFRNATRDRVNRTTCVCEGRHEGPCQNFNMSELCTALNKANARGACGTDEISNSMLKHLPISAKQELLNLMNETMTSGIWPPQYKQALIVPIAKKNKDPARVESYRPISLLSCVSKIMERMLTGRIIWLLEKNNRLAGEQAGFRRARSCQDQLQCLVQSIVDGSNRDKPADRTVLALIDFRAAFDTVWRDGLLYKLCEAGTPLCLVRLVKSFLTDRKAKVRFEGTTSKAVNLKMGIPQGSTASPALFLVYIDSVIADLPAGIEASLFADDLAIWTRGPILADAVNRLQEGLDAVHRWAVRWKMSVNASKCAATFFAVGSAEKKFEKDLHLHIGGDSIEYDAAPVFLGVTFDRLMNMTDHVAKLRKKMAGRLRVLKALTGKAWGGEKEDLRTVWKAYVGSCLSYGSAAWLPSTTATGLLQLQIEVNAAARTITGAAQSTPTGPLLAEAGLLPMTVQARLAALAGRERALRLPASNPASRALHNTVGQRLKTQASWRESGRIEAINIAVEGLPREKISGVPAKPPWQRRTRVTIDAGLKHPVTRKDTAEVRRAAAAATIADLPRADIRIWTDGAALDGLYNGGGGILVQRRGGSDESISIATGRFVGSYAAEQRAFRKAVQWIMYHATEEEKQIHIFTDSQSLLRRLEKGPSEASTEIENQIWTMLDIIGQTDSQLHLQFVPGHAGIPGNEQADALAKLGTQHRQSDVAVTMAATMGRARREWLKKWRKEESHPLQPHGLRPPPPQA